MILLVDAGNSRIKWGIARDGGWLARGVRQHDEIQRLSEDWAPHPIAAAGLSWVAGAVLKQRMHDLLQARGIADRWLTPQAEAHGLVSAYQPPQSLGADRYAGLLAAHRRGLGACLVVSVGTAITADALTADGRFLGGVIAPGPELMRESLRRGTAGAGLVEQTADGFPIATGQATATGIALAQAGVVAGLRRRLEQYVGAAVPLLLTGGARAILAGLLEPPVLEADDLVLEGLAAITKEGKWEESWASWPC